MATGITLNDAIDEYLQHRRANRFAENTIRANQRALKLLLAEVGNIQMRHFDAQHGSRFRAFLTGKGYAPNSVNAHLNGVSAFAKWAHVRGHLPKGNNPMALVKRDRPDPEPRQIVHPRDFARLLDAAHHTRLDPLTGTMVDVGTPHDRIVVALGLYLFLRQSEIMSLRIKDIDLDRGEVFVRVHKSKVKDVMPISKRLAVELRRWLTWYANDARDAHGALSPDWYLVPRRKAPILEHSFGYKGAHANWRETGNCVPMLPNGGMHRNVQRALVRFGMPIRGADGVSMKEGVHTLRRSGARAVFDRLTESKAYDGALRQVAAMLHHRSTATTERYLQISVDVKVRNDLFRNEDMFGEDEFDKVTPIRVADTGNN